MESLIFYIIFIILCFSIFAIAVKIVPKDALFTIAIGAVIGSNVYNSISYPIKIFGLIFGIDSIVFSIFMFCLLVMYIDYGKKSFEALLYTSLFSIFFTAFLFFMGTYSKTGFTQELFSSTIAYIYSIIGTFLAAIAMVKLFDVLKSKNVNIYINIFLCMIISSIINSFIYFAFTFISNPAIIHDMLISLAGSYIGKLISSGLCLLIYLLFSNTKKRIN